MYHINMYTPVCAIYVFRCVFHHYFSLIITNYHKQIHFDRSHYVELDTMVHCAITDIRYSFLTFGVLPAAERAREKAKIRKARKAIEAHESG